jgi:transcriptional regulator of arginine metabolism
MRIDLHPIHRQTTPSNPTIMPSDHEHREARQQVVLAILESERVTSQGELVDRLLARGIAATQSSVSRDLRDLGAFRRNGLYELPAEHPGGSASFAEIVDYITGGQTVGDHMILLEVQRGTAGLVANILDESGWADIAGVMASIDDKVLILTEDGERQRNLLRHLPYKDDD